ncbi:hypothetical protein BGZ63DRAFT_383431 [Mariannaea sp. PMI_226]|nr:hypothetical protein BGZ63DRAFT_383431 [Mariannaea sp. PMI_226]
MKKHQWAMMNVSPLKMVACLLVVNLHLDERQGRGRLGIYQRSPRSTRLVTVFRIGGLVCIYSISYGVQYGELQTEEGGFSLWVHTVHHRM